MLNCYQYHQIIYKMKEFHVLLGNSLVAKLSSAIKSFVYANGELTLNVYNRLLSKVLFFLKHHSNTQYKVLTDITAVDYPSKECRFEVVYHLLSIRYNSRIRIKTSIGELDTVDTSSDLFPSAN